MNEICLSEDKVKHFLFRFEVHVQRVENEAKYLRKAFDELKGELD